MAGPDITPFKDVRELETQEVGGTLEPLRLVSTTRQGSFQGRKAVDYTFWSYDPPDPSHFEASTYGLESYFAEIRPRWWPWILAGLFAVIVRAVAIWAVAPTSSRGLTAGTRFRTAVSRIVRR